MKIAIENMRLEVGALIAAIHYISGEAETQHRSTIHRHQTLICFFGHTNRVCAHCLFCLYANLVGVRNALQGLVLDSPSCRFPEKLTPLSHSLIWRFLIKYVVPFVLTVLLVQIFKNDVQNPYEVPHRLPLLCQCPVVNSVLAMARNAGTD